MALKSVLTSLEGLSEELKKEYTEKDGKFYLNLEGLDDHPSVGALKRAKDHEKGLRQAAEAAQRAAEDKVVAKDTELEGLRTGAIPKADVDALRTSFETKQAEQQTAFDAKYGTLTSQIEKVMLDSAALKMATELSTVPSLMVPHIRSRLRLEDVNGELVVHVADAAGKPSAATLDDLRNEMLQNKNFAPILIGSKASGGGANGGSGGGGAPKKLAEMNDAQRIQFKKDDPEGFRRQSEELRKAAAGNRF